MKQTTIIAAMLMATQSISLSHRSWLFPSTTILSSEKAWVTIDAAISNDLFYSNHHAMGMDGIVVTDPAGKVVAVKNEKEARIRTTFDIEVSMQGTYEVEARRDMVFLRWMEGGEKKVWRGQLAELEKKDLSKKEGLEISKYSIRNTTYITNGKPSLTALKPVNTGLELSFIDTHPNDLVENEEATFAVLHNGQAAKNIEIEVHLGNERYRNEKQPIKVKTDDQGKFSVTFKQAGAYWIQGYTKFNDGKTKGIEVTKKDAFNAVLEVMPE